MQTGDSSDRLFERKYQKANYPAALDLANVTTGQHGACPVDFEPCAICYRAFAASPS